jgi:hypothetical protein
MAPAIKLKPSNGRFVRTPDLRHFVLDSHFKRSKSDKA